MSAPNSIIWILLYNFMMFLQCVVSFSLNLDISFSNLVYIIKRAAWALNKTDNSANVKINTYIFIKGNSRFIVYLHVADDITGP